MNHFSSDHGEQERRENPSIRLHHRTEQRPSEPSDQRHCGLEDTERESGNQDFAPGEIFPFGGSQRHRNGESVHRQTDAQQNRFNQKHRMKSSTRPSGSFRTVREERRKAPVRSRQSVIHESHFREQARLFSGTIGMLTCCAANRETTPSWQKLFYYTTSLIFFNHSLPKCGEKDF